MVFPFLPQVAALNGTFNWLIVAAIGAGLLLLIFVAAVFVPWLQDFRRELRYLNSEIDRTEGREQQHWIKKKKKLIRSILPFFHYHG